MTMPTFTMRQLLEAGVHFGHNTRLWNPKMKPFIFGVRNNIHVLDLQQTVPLLNNALQNIRDIAAKGGRILFVGTKKQAQGTVAEAAKRCGQYYVNHRWLGGMLTNWNTMSTSIKRLREVTEILGKEETGLTKKETLMLTREHEKLQMTIGGIKDMGGKPDAIFIIDVNKEDIAVLEANKLGVPVFAILDSNSSPEGVDFPVPGNDDALRSIELYCDLFAAAILDGIAADLAASGEDVGAAVEAPAEELPAADTAEKADDAEAVAEEEPKKASA
ncbi:MAG: 30S ribosomal protein S2 [Micavibrio sp.]|nr:30S ribosomal protein S2 [Micavibrio sp.]